VIAFDWVVASDIATAVATFVLALATYAAVRSGNRAARVAEQSLLASLRPLLMPTKPESPPQQVEFADNRWFELAGGEALAEVVDGAIYLAIGVRNVGSGIAVLHGWYVHPERQSGTVEHAPIDGFRRLTRDLYVAPGDEGFWQGAIRDENDPLYAAVRAAVEEPHAMSIEVLYGDPELGQRSVSRFGVTPREGGGFAALIARHWNIDRPDPR
jgi:hypothetical protein